MSHIQNQSNFIATEHEEKELHGDIPELQHHDTDTVEIVDFTEEEAGRALRKVDLVLIPILMLIYLHKNMDAFIVSYLTIMNPGTSRNVLVQLNMTTNDWGLLTTFLTAATIIGEVPSNLLLKKATPRLHFLRVIVLWSLAGALGATATNKGGIWTSRFFLGLFEAGMYPGILAHLTFYYRSDEIAVRMIVVSGAAAFSSILDAIVAWAITFMNGSGGISAWQWALILLGLAGVPVGAIVWAFLPNYPDTAKFLTPRERQIILSRLPKHAGRSTDPNFDTSAILADLRNPLLYCFTAMMLFHNVGTYGLSFWLPTIIASFGFTTTQSSQLLNIPPAVIGLAAAITWAYLSDHTLSVPRPIYIIGTSLLSMGAFFGLAFITNKPALYAMTIIASIGSQAFFAVLMPWRAQTLRGTTSTAFSYAFQIALSQFSGIIGPQLFRSEYAPAYTIPFMICVVFQFLGILAVCAAWYFSRDTERAIRAETKLRRQKARDLKLTGEGLDI